MNIETTLAVLHREGVLQDHTPHSAQFRDLTACLLGAFSAAGAIPALSAADARFYAARSPLHDIGKRAIPPELLNKPGPLTQEEFEVIKSHTTQGCELLKRIPALRCSDTFPLICDVCRHHHERWDGGGYPDGLAGQDIAPWVQVVGLADAFDALIHPRVYKPPYPPGQAIRMIMGGACGTFDPVMLVCFQQNISHICHAVYA